MVEVILEALNLEDLAAQDTYIACRVGESQKLARIAQSRHFKFPQSAVGDRKVGKVDVLQRVGSINIHIKQDKSDAVQEIEIPAGADSSKAKFRVLLDGATVENASNNAVAEKPLPKEVNPKVVEARSYLQVHNLEVRLSEAMQAVLRVRPDNPSEFIFQRLLQSEVGGPKAQGYKMRQPDSPAKAIPSSPKTPKKKAPEGESVPTTSLTAISELEPPPLPGTEPELPPQLPREHKSVRPVELDDFGENVCKSVPPPRDSSVPPREPSRDDSPPQTKESKSLPSLELDAVVPDSLPVRSPAASEVPTIRLAPTPRWNQRPAAAPFVSSAVLFRLKAQKQAASPGEPALPSGLLQKCVEVVVDDCREKIGRSMLKACKNGNLQSAVQELVGAKSALLSGESVLPPSFMQTCIEGVVDESREKMARCLLMAAKTGNLETLLQEAQADMKPASLAEEPVLSAALMRKCMEVVVDESREKIGRGLLKSSMNGGLQAVLQELASERSPSQSPVLDELGALIGKAELSDIQGVVAGLSEDKKKLITEVVEANDKPASEESVLSAGLMQKCVEVVVDESVEELRRGVVTAAKNGRLQQALRELADTRPGCSPEEPKPSFDIMQKCVEAVVDDKREKLGRGLIAASKNGSMQELLQELGGGKSASSPEEPVLSPALLQQCVQVVRDECRVKTGRGFLASSKNGSLQALLQGLATEL